MGKIKNGTREASMDPFLYVYVYVLYLHVCIYMEVCTKIQAGAVGCSEVTALDTHA